MSAVRVTRFALGRLVEPRGLAVGGGLLLTATYLTVLYRFVDVVGDRPETSTLVLAVVVAGILGVFAARVLGPALAVSLGVLILVGGLSAYVIAVPGGSIDLGRRFADVVALVTGLSVLRMTMAGLWALGFAPAPVFLTGYFLARRAYAPAVLVGGVTLGFLVLTGDAGSVLALVGVVGGAAAIGFGQLDHDGALPALRDGVLVVLVAMIVVTTTVSLVPGGTARPLLPGTGSTTVETSLTDSPGRVDVLGTISLGATARFTVSADAQQYWRVGAYDRYTGDGWVRTGGSRPYDSSLSRPPADDVRPVRQRFRAESEIATMPAAWKPRTVEAGADRALVTALGGLEPSSPLDPGDRYTVVSLVPATDGPALRAAGRDYPASIEERYLGLPESTPDRLRRFTADLTAPADSPYEAATIVRDWLRENKRYSLEVDRPEGDVASAFVFEMDAGYCTYYATAMVAMLRTQGIPARFVVGYLPGEPVGEDEWLVRGYDSHAWVEVYVPDTGWVRFDPTPAGPRSTAERAALQTARANDVANVDTAASRPADRATPTAGGGDADDPGAGGPESTPTTGAANATNITGLEGFGAPIGAGEAGGGGRDVPTETVLYALVLLVGGLTALLRLGVLERLSRAVWLRRLPDGPPADRVEAAQARAEYLLGRRHRPRRAGETRRDYLAALEEAGIEEPVRRLFDLGERARYGGRASAGDAERAEQLLRELLA